MRLSPRTHVPRWLTPFLAVLALGITLALTAGPIRLAGANPGAAFNYYLLRPLTSSYSILEVFLAATPLLFTGLAALVAFRSGYYNIGGEGQFIAGAIAATAIAGALPGLPAVLALPIGLAGGALAGAVWGLAPALLRVRRGIDEVVTTLLLNPVALLLVQGLLNGPWRNPDTGFPESAPIPAAYELPRPIPGARLHAGIIVALLIALAIWITLRHTTLGLESRAVGSNAPCSRGRSPQQRSPESEGPVRSWGCNTGSPARCRSASATPGSSSRPSLPSSFPPPSAPPSSSPRSRSEPSRPPAPCNCPHRWGG